MRNKAVQMRLRRLSVVFCWKFIEKYLKCAKHSLAFALFSDVFLPVPLAAPCGGWLDFYKKTARSCERAVFLRRNR
ncbi:MAG: hypothetical protein LUE95_04845, partial [Oscillospiraceae bacterium]|nr:hypothetical protein [Oscillospiraceae bacterium]